MISSQAYVFETPLIEGVVIKRNSQFTMTIEAEGQNAKAHCPTTTRIGDIDIAGRPCLLSKSKDPNRKTLYTVEAISLNRPEDNEKAWIGINENAANRYVLDTQLPYSGKFFWEILNWISRLTTPILR